MPGLIPRPRYIWKLPRGPVALGERTLLMGILNLTPDSFFDGGRHGSPTLAHDHGLQLLDQGADILDLGAESTRPNATPLSATEEQSRLLPILEGLRRARPNALLSADIYHADTAARALELGADVINDVSGLLWDTAMPEALRTVSPAPGLVLMHTRGTPQQWTAQPPLQLAESPTRVRDELAARLAAAVTAGLDPETIVLDPGFGFGKQGAENYSLLASLALLHQQNRPLLVGLSRKRFLVIDNSARSNTATSDARLHATIAANTAAILAGAHILRVHDVAAALAAASVADRILNAGNGTAELDL